MKKYLIIVLTLVSLLSCSLSGKSFKDKESNSLEKLYKCTNPKISDSIKVQHTVVFENFAGFKKFIEERLEPWMLDVFHKATIIVLRKKQISSLVNMDIDSVSEEYYLTVKKLLTERGGYTASEPEYCGSEMQSIVESLQRGKLYKINNPEFTEFALFYEIPLNIWEMNNYFFLLMYLNGEYNSKHSGLCKAYSQQSDGKFSRVTLCN